MKQAICIFEDDGYENLLPLVYLRPAYDLLCGILTLREKITRRFPKAEIILHTRNYLADFVKEKNPGFLVNELDAEIITFINGRLLVDDSIAASIKKLKEDSLLHCGKNVAAAKLSKRNYTKIILADGKINFGQLTDIDQVNSNAKLIDYPWDLVNYNGKEIENDFTLLSKSRQTNSKKFKAVEIINKKNVFIGKRAIIDPFVVLDASNGPIYIGNDARIMSHASIEGPAYIGESTVVKMHASVYHNTSIGKVCKVGGEVENSIMHSYSNKQHEGFLGHSYLGSWVNIGASTNNSDLKNNYGIVEVLINNKPVNSGSQFAGLFMGDHSKTGINTMFNTGTVVGVSCNVFGNGFPSKFIPSFSWCGLDSLNEYDLQKALETAQTVMKRRNVETTSTEKELLKTVFELTRNERQTTGGK
ncbi:MAG: GlmU family protein [Ignavibacteriales bacterium]|nr:GlmU family protein [Ignavibacteriales bacterium]